MTQVKRATLEIPRATRDGGDTEAAADAVQGADPQVALDARRPTPFFLGRGAPLGTRHPRIHLPTRRTRPPGRLTHGPRLPTRRMIPQRPSSPPRQPGAPDRHDLPSERLRRRPAGGAVRDLLVEFRRRAAPQPPARRGPAQGPGQGLRVASYNLHKCVGTDGRFDPVRSAAVIAELGAELVAVQEADRRFGRRIGLLDAAALERETGLAPLPVSDLPGGHGWHGNALLVRPGTPARLRRLALPGAEPRGALVAELDLPAGRLRVVAAHLGLLRRCRARQVAAILQVLAEGEPMPTLLLGDLNEWRPGARSSLRALEPLFGPIGPGPASFPSRLPILALDRILGWPQGLVSEVAVHDSPLARVASDHLPLIARVRLDAAAEAEPPLAAAA